MQFRIGAKVFTADKEQVGTIDRVVVDPDTREVTHLVVRKGFLFTEDKVIPKDLVDFTDSKRVILQVGKDELEGFPDFLESEFIPADRDPEHVAASETRASSLYWYPPVGRFAGHAKPQYVVKEENIPRGTVAIQEGADVISRDGEHVGDIERIFTDPEEEYATHLLISEGMFLKEKKLVPTQWIKHVFESELRLSVDSELVESLPEYQVKE